MEYICDKIHKNTFWVLQLAFMTIYVLIKKDIYD